MTYFCLLPCTMTVILLVEGVPAPRSIVCCSSTTTPARAIPPVSIAMLRRAVTTCFMTFPLRAPCASLQAFDEILRGRRRDRRRPLGHHPMNRKPGQPKQHPGHFLESTQQSDGESDPRGIAQ